MSGRPAKKQTEEKPQSPPAGAKPDRRAHRARTKPAWLMDATEIDQLAQRRCLMVLDVVSGLTPVTDAIAEAGISRGTYYKLEERALKGMVAALLPGSDESSANTSLTARISELEQKVRALEREKRRAERLLLLTRKVVRPGPLTTGRGRPPGSRNRKRSTKTGRDSSTSSTAVKPAGAAAAPPPRSPSTPTPAGAAAP